MNYTVLNEGEPTNNLLDLSGFDRQATIHKVCKEVQDYFEFNKSIDKAEFVSELCRQLFALYETSDSLGAHSKYRAHWGWKATCKTELHVEPGEILYLVKKTNDEWWKMINMKGISGYFPASRLRSIS